MGSVGTSNHLSFEKLPLRNGEKLNRYKVFNHDLYETIGEIHWRGGWMQYVFQAITHIPADVKIIDGIEYVSLKDIIAIDMSRGCHKQIDDFIDKLMTEWRANKKNQEVNDG